MHFMFIKKLNNKTRCAPKFPVTIPKKKLAQTASPRAFIQVVPFSNPGYETEYLERVFL
jgi:hypothetical protein